MPDDSASPPSAAPKARRPASFRLTALIIACAMFMEQVDATVLATALPTIARDYDAPVASLSALITAYLLALAIFIPVSGRLADRYGARSVFRAAVLMFMAASLLCAFSTSVAMLTAARFVQGMAGAVMVPVGRLALLRVARKDEIVAATSWLIMPTLLGPMIGPALGGFIVTHVDWRWIFYLNLPIGAVGVVLISLYLDDSRNEVKSGFDAAGFLLSAAAFSALLFGFEGASDAHKAVQSAALIAVGLAAGAVYILHARRHPSPVLDLRLLRDRSFRLSLAGGSLMRVTQGAQPFLLPLLFQVGLGMSAALSGLIVLAVAVGAMVAKALVTRAFRLFGFRNSLIFNGLAASLSFAVAGLIRADWPLPAIVAVLLAGGFFISMQFSAYNSIAFENIEPARLSSASSFYSTFQQMLLSVGVCAGALGLHAGMVFTGHAEPRPGDFTVAFLLVCGISALAVFTHLRFPPDAGSALGGRAPARREPQ